MRSKNSRDEGDVSERADSEGAVGDTVSAGGIDTAERRSRHAAEEEGMARAEAAAPERPAAGPAEDPRLERARELEREGKLKGAIALYRELTLEQPAALAPRLALGAIYERQAEHGLALEQYEAAREIAPDNVDVLLGMAAALTELKRYDQAEAALRRAVRLEPARAAVHASIGTLSYKRGLYGQAEQELKRALDLDPAHAVAYFYRGESLNQLGRVDEALEMLERAVQLHPRNARAFFTMGILYDRKHLPQQAAAMYRKAREVTPA